MIKAIIFDLDNTLIDFMGTKTSSCNAAIDSMKEAGLKIPKKRALKILFSLYKEKGIEHQRIFELFLKKLLGKIDYKILAAGIIGYRRMKAEKLKTYPHVEKTLTELKRKYRLAILSDAPPIQAWTRLVEMDLQNYFDIVVTYNDTHKRKPHPKPFLAVLKRLRLKSNEVVMIGDSLLRDVKGAKKLGIKTILAEYGNVQGGKGIKPDAKITDIKMLPRILRRLQ